MVIGHHYTVHKVVLFPLLCGQNAFRIETIRDVRNGVMLNVPVYKIGEVDRLALFCQSGCFELDG